MSYAADDLDDGLDYAVEEDHVVLEEAEDGDVVESDDNHHLENEETDKKRPLEEDKKDDDDEGKTLSKRQKKLAKSSLHQKKLERMEYERSQKKNLPKSSVDQIVEYLATLIREKNPDLSALELDELYFKKQDFLSTERYEKERSLSNFQDFINTFSKAPRAIILSLSNLRVADVYRSVNGHQNAVKLFSKNKFKDDLTRVEDLLGSSSKDAKGNNNNNKNNNNNNKKNNKKGKGAAAADKGKSQDIKYFISTPTRLLKLIENTELFFQGKEKLDIFIDASYLDPKNNTIFTADDFAVLCKVLKEFRKKKSSVKILLF